MVRCLCLASTALEATASRAFLSGEEDDGMFTGIVEEMGSVRELRTPGVETADAGVSLRMRARRVLEGARLGDSIAVDGACLTVTELDEDGQGFTVGLSPETLRRTALGRLQQGSSVNLERALPAHGRLDGHIVQGHVDGVGAIKAVRPDGDALWVIVEAPPDLRRYIVFKGYIAVNGTSLTVAEVTPQTFSFTLVAYSRAHCNLGQARPGDLVNLEVDVLAKYVESLLASGALGAPVGHRAGAEEAGHAS